jgi:dihydropteroate synthase
MLKYRLRKLEIFSREDACRELARIGADEAGVARMQGKARYLTLKAEGLKTPAGNIIKQEMLSLGGEAAVARGVINCSIPSTDVILMGTRKQMRALVRKLRPQPFGLKALSDELAALLDAEKCPLCLSHAGGVLRFDERVCVMGILNVTPDSFSNPGEHGGFEAAVEGALRMVEEGADLIDVGGESTRPGAPAVSEEEEIRRVVPVVEYLAARIPVPISVDTYKSSVARRAVAAGAAIVNDVSGLRLDPGMGAAVAETGAGLVVMHMRGTPRDMQSDTRYGDLVGEVYGLLAESVKLALEAGVERCKIAVDPGIGFGKSVAGNLTLLKRLGEFSSLGLPILVGASRKSFIGKTLGIDDPKDRLEGSLAAAALAVAAGAHIIRAHDVAATRRAVDLAFAVRRAAEE